MHILPYHFFSIITENIKAWMKKANNFEVVKLAKVQPQGVA